MKVTKRFLTHALFAFAVTSVAGGAFAADDFADGFVAAEARDYVMAAKKMAPLAKKGHPDAQMYVAMMFHSGSAGVYNEKEAVRLYHEAAESGNAMAQEYLAAAYREGWFGLKKNVKKAQYWESRLSQ